MINNLYNPKDFPEETKMVRQNKKKSPVVLFLLVFVAIVLLMFIANYRSRLKRELPAPKGGVERLSTYQGKLIAISPQNEVYVWDWNDLSDRPQISSINAQKVVAIGSDRLIWIPQRIHNVLVVSNLKADQEYKRIQLPLNKKCEYLQASSNGKYAVAALGSDEGLSKQIQLAIIEPDAGSIKTVATKIVKEGLKLNGIGISNDGTIIAAVGKSKKGWMFVASANDKQLHWDMAVEDCNELNSVVFSLDGKTVYATESGRRVYVFDIAGKKLGRCLEMDEYESPPHYPQTISCIAVSPDGRLLAATSSPHSRLWIWNVQTADTIAVIVTGHFSTSSIVFSPDSALLAGAVLGDTPIKIWKIPKNR